MAIITYVKNFMRFSGGTLKILYSNSGKISGVLLLLVSIVISFISMFMSEPPMKVDDSILILVAQFLTIGAGLLGLTLKENKSFDPPINRDRSSSKPKYVENNNNLEG